MDVSNSIFLNFLFIMSMLYLAFTLSRFISKFILFFILVLSIIVYIYGGDKLQKKLDTETQILIQKVFKLNKSILNNLNKNINKKNEIKEIYDNLNNNLNKGKKEIEQKLNEYKG